jgi:membrane protein
MPSTRIKFVLQHPWRFSTRVFQSFLQNQGFLLAGAIAYYTLLSIIPMLVLILVMVSQFQDPHRLLKVLQDYLWIITPGQTDAIVNQIDLFLQNRKVVGILGFVLLLFFSSFAFTALENAMAVIFVHRVANKRRHFMVSAIIPYLYILLLALGLLVISLVSGSLASFESRSLTLFGHHVAFSTMEKLVVYLFGVCGEILLLTSLYLVLPVGRLRFHHALLGGITAAVLWEITRHVLVWYFSTLSLVNVIYGTFAAAIVILVSVEAAAIIVLMGAQVIADYERVTPDIH